MAQNVGTFSLYLDLTINTKNAIRRLKGLETSLRQQVGQIFTGLNNSNLEGKLNNVLQSSFTSAIAKAGTGGSTVGLTFGNAVLAGITSIFNLFCGFRNFGKSCWCSQRFSAKCVC